MENSFPLFASEQNGSDTLRLAQWNRMNPGGKSENASAGEVYRWPGFCIRTPLAWITVHWYKWPLIEKTFICLRITTISTPLSLICSCLYLSILLSLQLSVSVLFLCNRSVQIFFYISFCFIISLSLSLSRSLLLSPSLSLGIRHSMIFPWHVVEVITPSHSLPHSISIIFLNLPAQSEVRISFSLSLINLSHLPFFHFPLYTPSDMPTPNSHFSLSPLNHPRQLLS